jgi:hypothetical protein
MGRVPAPGEATWTEQDRTIAMAWFAYRDGLCPGCGVARDDAWDIAAEGAWVGDVLHCHVCAAMDRARDRHLAQRGPDVDVDTAGLKTVARRRQEG